MSSVFSMVKQVLADSKEKIASQTPSGSGRAVGELPSGGKPSPEVFQDSEKVAKALDYLASNIHLVVDQRSPQEKLAEYHAITKELAKRAMEDEDKGSHQTQEAPAAFQSPMDPGMGGEQAGAGSNQMESGENTQSGDGVLEAGQSGEATSEKINPMSVDPNEAAFPGDSAGNALETTQDESDRPGGQETAPEKIARARAIKLAQLVSQGKVHQKTAALVIARDRVKLAGIADMASKGKGLVDKALKAADKGVRSVGKAVSKPATKPSGFRPSEAAAQHIKDAPKRERMRGALALGGGALAVGGAAGAAKAMSKKDKDKEAALSGVPPHMASALIKKLAADAENPAQISGGQEPELQTAQGAENSAQSQGHEAGESTPDTKGSDQGRDALQSVRAAINATKGQLKGERTRSEMGSYLNEPALSQAHDSVLQQSLENASSAGVKIAATKAILQKWASESPERAERLQTAIAKIKRAMPEGDPAMMAPGEASPVSVPAPGEEMPPMGAEGEEGAEPVSDAALAAAAQGVTPDDLAMAEAMLEEQMGAAGAGAGGGMDEGMMGGGEQAGVMGAPGAAGAPPVEPPAPPAA